VLVWQWRQLRHLSSLSGTEASGPHHARQLPLQWTRRGVASRWLPAAPRHTRQRNRLRGRHGLLERARQGAHPWAVRPPGRGVCPWRRQGYCRLRVPACAVPSVTCPPFALFVAFCQEVRELSAVRDARRARRFIVPWHPATRFGATVVRVFPLLPPLLPLFGLCSGFGSFPCGCCCRSSGSRPRRRALSRKPPPP